LGRFILQRDGQFLLIILTEKIQLGLDLTGKRNIFQDDRWTLDGKRGIGFQPGGDPGNSAAAESGMENI